MQKNRKICCRITPGRIVGTVLLAASAVNLIIVGAAFEVSFPKAVPAITATPSAFSVTTIPPPTATASYTPTFTAEPTDTPIPTWTTTSTATPTETATSTPTFTPSPVPTQCIPRYDWPVYRIQRGDTLSSLTQTTGSSVQELMLANCLIDSRIFAGQLLHVPRLPLVPATAVPLMPSDTSPLKNSAAVFKPNSMTCDGPGYVALSAAIYDLEGVTAAFVQLYTGKGEVITMLEMTPDGDIYFGSDSLPGTFTVNDVGYYIFSAVDQLEGVTKSQPYNDRSANCIPLPTDIPPVSPG